MGGSIAFFYKFLAILFFVSLQSTQLLAQTPLKGKVVDGDTGKAVAGATIRCSAHYDAVSTAADGTFLVYIDSAVLELSINALGYRTKVFTIHDTTDEKVFLLEREDTEIEAVEITKKQKYNKNNPAVQIIDLIIENKKFNKLSRKDSLYYRQYEKVKFGLVNPVKGFSSKLGDMSFFFKNLDSTLIKGKQVLAIYLDEEVSDIYVKQDPARTKQIIIAEEKTVFDPRYINNHNIESYINYIIQPVDIYDESIFFLNKLFLSPIADRAKTYYKYHIVDTVWCGGSGLNIRIKFEPFNKADLLFTGELLVPMNGRYAVQRAKMAVGKEANLSWVTALEMTLSYFQNQDGIMLQDTSHVLVQFGNGKNDLLFGERMAVNQDYNLKYPINKNIFLGAPVESRLNQNMPISELRPIELKVSELYTYLNVDSINHLKSFNTIAAAGYVVSQGYYPFKAFELGPLEYLFHRNNMEGSRVRLGGRSTQYLSDKVYLQGYLAYGFGDQKVKYYLKSAFSLNGKSVSTFPAHYIEAEVQHDVITPGRSLGFLKGDSFFRSFGNNRPTKWFDMDAYRLGHLVEFGNHVSVRTSFTYQSRTPLGDLHFVSSGDTSHFLKHINTNDIEVKLRWAPFEKFYYRNLERNTIIENHPVFTLQYNKGIKGLWGSGYNYDALRLSITKRFFMNQLGFGDLTVSGGKIWGVLPYPLLEIPNIQDIVDRHSISYERTSPMEFVADRYIKFAYDHSFNGFILNKLPFIKKLKLRENFGARMFYGGLSKANNPFLSDKVIEFDRDDEGSSNTTMLRNLPYWEGYVGVSNIFKVLRIDYYKRMNYVSAPNAQHYSFFGNLRFAIEISF